MAVAVKKTDRQHTLKLVAGLKSAPRAVRSQMDTIEITQELAASWLLPPFQRPLKVNQKVVDLAEHLKSTGVMPGVLTLGKLDKDTYLVDGQHRRQAFVISELPVVYSDVRICHFDTLAEMGEEFVNQNSHLVTLKPDDILRGLENSSPAIMFVRRQCPFIGYDNLRRGSTSSPVVLMSAALRSWDSSSREAPSKSTSTTAIAAALTEEEARLMVPFMKAAWSAWRSDSENYRLWGALNLTLCAWLWRNMVLTRYSARTTQLTERQFVACLMSLANQTDYIDWLLGRHMSEHNRAPAYARIKSAFVSRMAIELPDSKIYFPAPSWTLGHGR